MCYILTKQPIATVKTASVIALACVSADGRCTITCTDDLTVEQNNRMYAEQIYVLTNSHWYIQQYNNPKIWVESCYNQMQ